MFSLPTWRWDQWGRQHLKTGDVLFRMGDARLAHGYFKISRFLAKCSNSQFSHTGIASIEEDGVVVYDTTRTGVARQPFYVWVLDNVGDFGVKRVKPEYKDAIPKVMAYLHKVYEEQLPFDYELGEDDTALYCVEMTEKAYRAAGLKLSDPVRLGDMERATEFPLPLLVLAFASRYQLKHPLTPDSLVYFPGNERHGIWSAKQLMTIVPPTWAPGYPSDNEKAPAGRVGSTAKKPVEAKKVATPSVSPGASPSPGQDRNKTSRTTKGAQPKTVRTGAGVVPQRN